MSSLANYSPSETTVNPYISAINNRHNFNSSSSPAKYSNGTEQRTQDIANQSLKTFSLSDSNSSEEEYCCCRFFSSSNSPVEKKTSKDISESKTKPQTTSQVQKVDKKQTSAPSYPQAAEKKTEDPLNSSLNANRQHEALEPSAQQEPQTTSQEQQVDKKQASSPALIAVFKTSINSQNDSQPLETTSPNNDDQQIGATQNTTYQEDSFSESENAFQIPSVFRMGIKPNTAKGFTRGSHLAHLRDNTPNFDESANQSANVVFVRSSLLIMHSINNANNATLNDFLNNATINDSFDMTQQHHNLPSNLRHQTTNGDYAASNENPRYLHIDDDDPQALPHMSQIELKNPQASSKNNTPLNNCFNTTEQNDNPSSNLQPYTTAYSAASIEDPNSAPTDNDNHAVIPHMNCYEVNM